MLRIIFIQDEIADLAQSGSATKMFKIFQYPLKNKE